MDIQLHPWLEKTIQEQLLLGHNWQQDKHERKKPGVKTEFDRDWEGLYHDNGSCLDIINYIHPERNSALQVLQTSPLTLTDGRCQVVAHLTPDCIGDLAKRFPYRSRVSLHSIVAVRKYTIRYTSYGPPRDKLRFILQRVDWLGVNAEQVQGANSEPLKPLHSSEHIAAVLEQLHHTRTQEDLRCLRSDTEPEDDDEAMAAAMDESDGAPAGESTAHTQLPHTQFAFATQVVHPIQSRASDDEPQILGINRMEPVLAGNTRREEIRPAAANSENETRKKLLGLLNKIAPKQSPGKPSPTSAKGFVRTTFDKQQSVAKPSTTHTSPGPSVIADKQQTQAGAQEDKARPASPTPTRSKRRVREPKPISPAVVQPVEELSDTRQDTEQISLNDPTTPALECAWMKGFIFDREALRVPFPQQAVLQKPTSWHKPQPGYSGVTDGNIPITILTTLHRIADERAAMEGVSDTDSEEDFDPSPDSVVDPSTGAMPLLTQDDEPTTSQISWSASPSPEPPQKPARSHQGLPPDSSFEIEGLNANNDVDRQPTGPRVQSPLPKILNSSNDKEPSLPPSSPPIAELPADSDEEMEMETLVPQGLGEDALQASLAQSVSKNHESTGSASLKPVVQVKETPCAKGKNGQTSTFAMSPPRQRQPSSSNSKHTSSSSIVYGTYNEPSSSVSVEGKNRRDQTKTDVDSRLQNAGANAMQLEETEKNAARRPDSAITHKVPMPDRPSDWELPPKRVNQGTQARAVASKALVKELLPFQPEPTPVSAQIPPVIQSSVSNPPLPQPEPTPISAQIPSAVQSSASTQLPGPEAHLPELPPLASGVTKRKLVESPSKNSRRHSKRREIKIVGFGDDPPSAKSPVTTLRKERAESLRRFREERNSSTSFESRPRSIHEQQDVDAMEVDSPRTEASNNPLRAMSPRHRSLYEEPSPPESPSKAVSTPPPPPLASRSAVQPEVVSVESRPASVMERREERREQTRAATATIKDASLTVFDAFKAAYPEYTGGTKHFEALCLQIYQLDLEDKMVPKWQWDDFIIRNRTDYKDYAFDCADQGENPEPYFRFYKDSIRDTLFKAGIIENRATLLKALEELGVELPAPKSSRQPAKSPRKSKPSRTSLPGAFNVPKRPTQDRTSSTTHDRPRPSLPIHSHAKLQSSNPTIPLHKSRSPPQSTSHRDTSTGRRTSRSDLLQRLTSDPVQASRDATEGTGDPFRDYFFAVQRNTSWTGSTKVDRSKPWPQNLAVRPSNADVPRKKADVLKWRDEL